MRGDGLGQLLDQSTELADLGRHRVGGAAHALAAAFDRADAAVQFGDLAREVGSAAREVGDLVADDAAVAQPVGDAAVERHAGQRRQRGERRHYCAHLEGEKQHAAERGGDHHHADGDEYGADPNHPVPMPSANDRFAAARPNVHEAAPPRNLALA